MRVPTPEAFPNLLQPRGRRPRLAIFSGLAMLLALTMLRLSTNDELGMGLPYLMYVLAVMWASWVGGWIPGILVTLASTATVSYLFLGVPGAFLPISSTDVGRSVVFLVVGFMVSAFSEALHRERERLEERTRELQIEMRERRVQERERAELQQRKDQFLAILAHELRNPLTPIVNAVALLHARAGGDAVIERSAQMIDRHARQMVHLIDDLLDAARIERGTFELRREKTQVSDIIQAAVEHCRSAILEKQQRHAIRMPATALTIDADPLRLIQVVTNLLNNASTYTPEGGHIETEVKAVGETLHIVVRDSGRGMAPEDTERIFQMFERGPDRSATTGLGIGLALVRQIVALHAGRVEARSDGEGLGSTFTVQLPGLTVALHDAPAPQDTFEPTDVMRQFRILVVDDNPDLVESLAAVLQLLGHQVESAGSGEEALRLMSASPPDLAIMDVGMPGMSGYDVARRAALEAWRGRMTMVAMTGWGRDEDKQRALEAGFDVHVVKPLDLERLRALLDTLHVPSVPVEGLTKG